MDSSSSSSTNLDYFDMWKLQSTSTLLSLSEGSGRFFHPQGSGQPADTGVIAVADSGIKFVAEDVRSKDGIVFHCGFVENSGEESESEIRERPYAEYKSTVPQKDVASKQKELKVEANALMSRGVKISAALLPYEEACKLCGDCLTDYIAKDSIPRIVKLGVSIGCPCGGTRVSNISEIKSIMVVPMFLL